MNEWKQFENGHIASLDTRSKYSDYLQTLPWDYFATITFRRPWRDSIRAHEAVWPVLHDCGITRAFLAVERHKYPSYDCHVHGLLAGYGPEWNGPKPDIWKMWENCFHRFGRNTIEDIRNPGQVAEYCSKYVIKRLSEYGFYGQKTFWHDKNLTPGV